MDRDDNPRPTEGGGAPLPDVSGDAARLLQPWRRIGGQLTALIGESGFCALFGRALRTLAVDHEWLGISNERKSIAALLAAYEDDLARAAPARAASANAALLATFTGQLSALIGGALTARLLADASPEPAGRKGPQDAQEHSNDR